MKSSKTEIVIYTDGGSRGNPGDAAYGFVIYKNNQELYSEGKYLGTQTNNYAEYMGVIKSFEWVKKNLGENFDVKLYCDSLLVASQLNGKYKIKHPAIKPLVRKAKSLESYFNHVEYFHVLREDNKKADSMVNKALDKQLAS